ncbi:hypothetical protein K438DRAFT_1820170 [Mycena galopus ATCC 62051]|nr:hypothetical protein K438DRAFT_1820170 [Mycena galopus ATCC 62051]
MDASHMIPGGFQFIHSPLAGDGENVLLPYTGNEHVPNHIKTRTQAAPMRYYFIDFGLSVQFPSYETRSLVTGECGRLRKHLPEISETIPYDPFKVDVRLIGEMLRSRNTLGLTFSFHLFGNFAAAKQHKGQMRTRRWRCFGITYRICVQKTSRSRSPT